MDLSKSLEQKKFDTRLIDFNLKNKVISKEEYEKFLAQLPDLSNLCEKLDLEDNESGNGADTYSNHFQS